MMTEEEIIDCLKTTGLNEEFVVEFYEEMELFAKLVEKKVREECVKICDERVTAYQYATDPWAREHIDEAKHLAETIRARGQE